MSDLDVWDNEEPWEADDVWSDLTHARYNLLCDELDEMIVKVNEDTITPEEMDRFVEMTAEFDGFQNMDDFWAKKHVENEVGDIEVRNPYDKLTNPNLIMMLIDYGPTLTSSLKWRLYEWTPNPRIVEMLKKLMEWYRAPRPPMGE